MPSLIVVDAHERWNMDISGVETVPASAYLTERRFSAMKRAKVFNLCRATGYQTTGYYVSLLAEARGHRPLPSVSTIQDLRTSPLIKIASDDLEKVIQRTLADLKSDEFELSIYFGHNLAQRYERMCLALFNAFPAPLLRARFVRDGRWRLSGLRTIGTKDVPESHRDFVVQQARRYFARPRRPKPSSKAYRYDMAILVGPDAASDEGALQRFVRAGERAGIRAAVVDKEAYGRLAEYDALFIRETTAVNHHTYRFARRALAEGLVVVDDPKSIIRCTNKVYLAELFQRQNIACPTTVVVGDEALERLPELGFPCVVKQPDSSFSRGVTRANTPDELRRELEAVLERSELAIVQAYIPSAFDWRIGVIGGQPLYACRYYMARGDWRIQATDQSGRVRTGKVDTVAVADAPREAVELALAACRPIGDGFYGVDIKEADGRFFVIEVNDNPSVEAGYEDAVLKDELYARIMDYFFQRMESRRA